jgi:hypothetical protein
MANARTIVAGSIGAVVGFVGILALTGLTDFGRNDPIASGLIMLFFIGPAGGAAGAWLAIWLSRFTPAAKEEAAARGDKSTTRLPPS